MDFVAREHENVREHLDHMAAIAEAGPGDITVTLRNRLDAVFKFLHTDLLTLMAFEEETRYPALDRIPGRSAHTRRSMAVIRGAPCSSMVHAASTTSCSATAARCPMTVASTMAKQVA